MLRHALLFVLTTLAPGSPGRPSNATLGPTIVDGKGTDFALHLDTRKLGRAHLMADTPDVPGTTSPIALRLTKPDGSKLQDGWDVSIPSGTFTNLEWSPPAGVELDVVLHVASKDGKPHQTHVDVGLFDPLE